MTNRLMPIGQTRLHSMEVPQLVIRFIDDVETSKIKTGDEDFKRLFAQLKAKAESYAALQRPIHYQYDKKTLRQADKNRDNDLRALMAGIRMFKSSSRPTEREAYEKLMILTKVYKSVDKRHYEEETYAIGELLGQLRKETYSTSVTTLALTKLVTNLTESQSQFEKMFKTMPAPHVTKEKSAQIQQARQALFQDYQRLCEYVDSMVWVKGSEPYKNLLALINKGRQFYVDAVNRRKGKAKARKSTESSTSDTAPQLESSTKPASPIELPKEQSVKQAGKVKVENEVN